MAHKDSFRRTIDGLIEGARYRNWVHQKDKERAKANLESGAVHPTDNSKYPFSRDISKLPKRTKLSSEDYVETFKDLGADASNTMDSAVNQIERWKAEDNMQPWETTSEEKYVIKLRKHSSTIKPGEQGLPYPKTSEEAEDYMNKQHQSDTE